MNIEDSAAIRKLLRCCSVCLDAIEGKIYLCLCKIICNDCATPLTKCKDCKARFRYNARFSNFHERINGHLSVPCKHSCHGCEYVVKPNNEHGINCSYEPVACARCKLMVIKKQMGNHFAKEHYLRSVNLDVKFADFYLAENTGSREIKCVTSHGHNVFITLNVDDYNQFFLMYQLTDTTVSLKLEFILGAYSYSVINSKPPNSTDGGLWHTSFIDIDKEIFNDWVNGLNTLNITVTEGKKRQHKETADNEANKENADASATLMSKRKKQC